MHAIAMQRIAFVATIAAFAFVGAIVMGLI